MYDKDIGVDGVFHVDTMNFGYFQGFAEEVRCFKITSKKSY